VAGRGGGLLGVGVSGSEGCVEGVGAGGDDDGRRITDQGMDTSTTPIDPWSSLTGRYSLVDEEGGEKDAGDDEEEGEDDDF